MRVRVERAWGDRVAFRCEHGAAEAEWHGPPAAEGDERHVELELLGPLAWGAGAAAVQAAAPWLGPAGARVAVVGLLEATTGDGVAVLRLGRSLLMASVEGLAPEPGAWVRLEAEGLALYDERV